MIKETQVHATIEIVDVLPKFKFTGRTLEDIKEQARQALMAKFDSSAVDKFTIADVKIIEIEEEISTKDLIKAAKHCKLYKPCRECPIYSEGELCCIAERLADRLEELYKQLTAPQAIHTCDNCRYDMKGLPVCIDCVGFDNWRQKRG